MKVTCGQGPHGQEDNKRLDLMVKFADVFVSADGLLKSS
jgi:hypothetical protein